MAVYTNHLKNRNAVFLLASEGRESDDPAFLLVLRAASRRVSCRIHAVLIGRWWGGCLWLYMYTKQARMMLFSSVVHAVGSSALVMFSYPFPLYLPHSSPPFSLHHNPYPSSSSPTPSASTEEKVEVKKIWHKEIKLKGPTNKEQEVEKSKTRRIG